MKSAPKSASAIKSTSPGVVEQESYSHKIIIDQLTAELTKKNRELEIEAALEKVRAKVMAMTASKDLNDTSLVFGEQLRNLGINWQFSYFWLIDEANKKNTFWITWPDYKTSLTTYTLQEAEEFFNDCLVSWRAGVRIHDNFVNPEQTQAWLDTYQRITDDAGGEAKNVMKMDSFPNGVFYYDAMMKYGSFGICINHPASEEYKHIQCRFAVEFERAYTRFLDLQHAEAQAREAQIEAALEKVRSRSLAMHQSEELRDVVTEVFHRLNDLGFVIDDGAVGILIFEEGKKEHTQWIVDPKNIYPASFRIPYSEHSLMQDLVIAKEQGREYFSKLYPFEEKNEYFIFLFENSDYRNIPEDVRKIILESQHYGVSVAFAKNSGIIIPTNTGKLLSQYQQEILKRFVRVFEQAYIRFLDLQKAEAQAREAQIEAALERVRAKAMGMHTSNDLSVTACAVFTELRHLGIHPIRCGVGLLTRGNRKAQLYAASTTDDGDSLALVGWIHLEGHPVMCQIYDSWVDQKEFLPEMECEELKSYYKVLLAGLSVPVPDIKTGEKQFGCFLPFTVGFFYAWSDVKYEESQLRIMKRFATIMDLTFRRYMELQQAEVSAKEALKQATLDRIRADIASMRSVKDLDRIIPLIWTELCTLGIPFIRCGVFIMDEEQHLIHTFLSAPDGRAIAAFHLDYELPGKFLVMLNHWRKKQPYIDLWTMEDFETVADIIVEQGSIGTREQYLGSIPKGGFQLHFLPFLQGMLYVGNMERLIDEHLELIQRIADAFSTAYARYEDFSKLEMAKQQVENTLTDLRQAQLQLIQSEKMASLGEMTAGIAHEIQNPLNFVNNFAEINTELNTELREAISRGNLGDAEEVAQFLLDNEQKILQHGKRAEAIVKGMLQHTRSGSGVKEPTDINALADEMLRLSFHGFRAKDKSFQADYIIHGDSSLPLVNIVPQDFSRVLLNIINNAFYAVNEKRKQGAVDYKPLIELNTSCQDGKLLVTIKDNGNGIPESIMNKIFQPFFTTKPSGQGTGLGLSLSYDVVRAHGGEIRVESKEGQGTIFSVCLPY
ncbi:MAG TPA: ATP-binding protein [Chitinophagaceae bacterium]|nr:ATP-binding protein [Chitinophagaceae bacterium]